MAFQRHQNKESLETNSEKTNEDKINTSYETIEIQK